MTCEEAIKIIQSNRPKSGYMMLNEALDIAISALERDTPKVAEHDDGPWSICPFCEGSVCNDTEHAVNGEVSYCEHCGQAIDWRLSNENYC